MICPQAGFARKADFGFASSADLSSHIFFDHIQELKRDRIRLTESRIGFCVDIDLVNPGQITCEIMFAKFLENLAKTTHQEGEIIVNFLKTASDIIFFHEQRNSRGEYLAENRQAGKGGERKFTSYQQSGNSLILRWISITSYNKCHIK